MNKLLLFFVLISFLGCKNVVKTPTAQEIVDKSIAVSGGENYVKSNISFDFRDIHYTSEVVEGKKILKRKIVNDSTTIIDTKYPNKFERSVNDSIVTLSDSMANVYANSVNSVHYFAMLPYGLNDKAVKKKFLETVKIDTADYYKIEVTFSKEGGGDDFDDVYLYWFNTKTLEPDYLSYEFHTNGGGQRFRVAYNKRTVGGIRFVDYKNYKPKQKNGSIYAIDSLYVNNGLELLSEIKLENVEVNQDSYN
ncbi:DUF6503 family protein [Maribacter thermophilus]|uniref:DUF6503 family protein n=1 Tax=Maribacter thermophilus TaxID=1197874 RepID=UPI00064109FD|nr:DUF6503 family protein [Maribacter thermophilus]